MSYAKEPFYKSSTFWTHFAVVSASLASGVTAVFDTNFLDAHPTLAAVIVAASAVAAAVSQFGYSIARGMKATAQANSVEAAAPSFPETVTGSGIQA